MTLQFCLSGRDISGDPYARVDADEVRMWDDETLLLAVTDVARPGEQIARWVYSGSDVGHSYSDAQMAAEHEAWQDALESFGLATA
jgi:hypothetical protein